MRSLSHEIRLSAIVSLALLCGCKTTARCAFWVLDAFDHDTEFDRYREEQKRQMELEELYRQADEEAMQN